MPYTPPKNAGPESVYDEAGLRLFHWIKEGIFTRDRQPAIYVYQQKFSHMDRQYVRRGFIARLRLEEFGTGSVFPHEQTYGGPKEDRLLLTKFTRCNMSQVFCLFDDDTNTITETLYKNLPGEPTYKGTLEDVINEVWVVTEPAVLKFVTDRMRDRKIFIADGHHRYSTSLMYRNYLKEKGKLTENHPANYVNCMFVSMSEPGLVILPTHRCITQMTGLKLDELAKLLEEQFELQWTDAAGAELEDQMNKYGQVAFAFVNHGENRAILASAKEAEKLLADLTDQYVLAWRTLPVAVLHRFILDRLIYPKWLKTEKPAIEYFHLAEEVKDYIARTPETLGILVPPTKIEAVRQISLAGQLMPQKSTFFYPKLATGLVIHPLFD